MLKSVVCFLRHLSPDGTLCVRPVEAAVSDAISHLPLIGVLSRVWGLTDWERPARVQNLGGKWGPWPEVAPGVVSLCSFCLMRAWGDQENITINQLVGDPAKNR